MLCHLLKIFEKLILSLYKCVVLQYSNTENNMHHFQKYLCLQLA